MPLPKSIEAAGARADEFLRQQQGTPVTPAPTEVPPQQQAPVPAPVAAPAPDPTPAIEAGWEKRFRVLQGKYDAEVPRLHGELRDMRTQLQTAMSELDALKARPVTTAPDLSVLTPEEREQYGEEFINVMAKVAKANAAPVAQVDPNLNQRLDRIESQVAETAEEGFFRKLGAQAANWETLNTDPGFLGWLADVDDFTGRTRQQLFNDAYNHLDVARVAKFFNAYGGNQSHVERANERPSLEQQVTPRPNGAAPAPPQGKKIWTAGEIAKFYDNMRRGVFRDAADAARIEADIFAAQREGRVR
jgi:hypothetical protein